MQSIAWSLLMLLLVLAMIPMALWLVKRLQAMQPGGAPRQLEVLAQLALGPRERLLMVRVQGRVLVLGATAQQITLLGEADAPSALADTAPAGGAAASFAASLFRARAAQPAERP